MSRENTQGTGGGAGTGSGNGGSSGAGTGTGNGGAGTGSGRTKLLVARCAVVAGAAVLLLGAVRLLAPADRWADPTTRHAVYLGAIFALYAVGAVARSRHA